MRAARDEEGFTLIELLIAMVLSTVVIGVLTASFVVAFRATGDAEERLTESHDAQLLATTLSADLQSVAPGGVDTDAAAVTGCAGTSPGQNVLRLQWVENTGAAPTRFSVSYRYQQVDDEWLLVRHACDGPDLAVADADDMTVAHALHPTIAPVVVGSDVERGLLLTLASGYQFTITGSRRTASTTSSSTTTPPSPQRTLLSAAIRDTDADGKVDEIVAEFNGTLTSGAACTTGWSSSVSATVGTLGAVTVSGTNAVIDVTEGSLHDTAWTGVTVTFAPAAACNALGATITRTDEAAPVLRSVTNTQPGTTAGRLQPADVLTFTLSEPVTGVPATGVVLERDLGSGDELEIAGILGGVTNMGSRNYMSRSGSNNEASFLATITNLAGIISVTVGACPDVNDCLLPTQSSGDITFTIAPAIKDAAGFSVAAPLALTGFRVF